uniref:YopX protein domain-containing protein n=1 Tax=Rhizobium phage IG49 TaxID=3129228 RepID=A0AAU8HZ69_9CAUD
MSRGIYRFSWDCGRNGDIDGIFSAEENEVKEAIGKNVNFGEALGKHSEVYGVIEEGEIVLVTDDVDAVRIFDTYGFGNGYNPLHYIRSDEEE